MRNAFLSKVSKVLCAMALPNCLSRVQQRRHSWWRIFPAFLWELLKPHKTSSCAGLPCWWSHSTCQHSVWYVFTADTISHRYETLMCPSVPSFEFLLNTLSETLCEKRPIPSVRMWLLCTASVAILRWCTLLKDNSYIDSHTVISSVCFESHFVASEVVVVVCRSEIE